MSLGVDLRAVRLAGEWAQEQGIEVKARQADWKRFGRGAGPKRNRQMLEEKPDLVVAFPGGRGTAGMIRVATKAGLQVIMAEEMQ